MQISGIITKSNWKYKLDSSFLFSATRESAGHIDPRNYYYRICIGSRLLGEVTVEMLSGLVKQVDIGSASIGNGASKHLDLSRGAIILPTVADNIHEGYGAGTIDADISEINFLADYIEYVFCSDVATHEVRDGNLSFLLTKSNSLVGIRFYDVSQKFESEILARINRQGEY